MFSRVGALAFGATVLSVCTPAWAAPTYISVDIRDNGPTVLTGINAKGDAIGSGVGGFIYKADGTINIVNLESQLSGINKQGEFVGDMVRDHAGQKVEGIIGRSSGKIVTKFFVPDGKTRTEFTGGSDVNDAGEVTGVYANTNDNYASHGFVRDPAGAITTFDAPGAGNDGDKAEGTTPLAINASGTVTGYFRDPSPMSHCFIRNSAGTFTTVDPNPGHSASCNAINDGGAVVGSFSDGTFGHGFVRSASGNVTAFDALEAAQSTVAYDISNKGVIVGRVVDSAGVTHGFVRTRKGAVTVFDVPELGDGPTKFTSPAALNDKGETVGFYIDGANITHGFIRLP